MAERRRKNIKKEEVSPLRLHECWPSFVGHLFSGFLPSVCLCDHPYKSLYRFEVEIWDYTKREYNLDDQFLDIRSVFYWPRSLR